MFAAASGRPERLVALHFHLPVWDANVADVMAHPGTSADVVETVTAFARRIGQIPIVAGRESSGYVFNAMLSALIDAALRLVAGGVAEVADVDRAWMGVMKMPIGPFGIIDAVGLDTVWKITDFWAGATGDPQSRANADLVRGYIAVSYTHLDVYKRQPLGRAPARSRSPRWPPRWRRRGRPSASPPSTPNSPPPPPI